MKFGWLTLALSPSPEEDAVRIDDQIEQVCAAESLGFDDVWLTEHYFTGESVYNDALLFASALTMRTTRIRIGFAVIQMPFHHPIRLDGWVFLEMWPLRASSARGTYMGTVHDRSGNLGCVLAQEALLRVRPDATGPPAAK